MYPFDRLLLLGPYLELIMDMDPLDDQHLAVLLNFTCCFRNQLPFTCCDTARFQRASKGAGQSARRRGDHIIKCGRMRLVNLRVNPIMFRYL